MNTPTAGQAGPAWRSVARGSMGLAAVSVAAYSVWAFVPRAAGSEAGLYALIATVYLGGTGLALSGLLSGERRMARFHALFIPAFLLYAAAWSIAWFSWQSRPGEWLASLAGTQAFALATWARLGRPPGYWMPSLGLFALHSAGYFAGGFVAHFLIRGGVEGMDRNTVQVAGKLAWGLLHGLGFGAGMGWVLHRWQAQVAPRPTPAASGDTPRPNPTG